jgi:hypothetical protein
MSDHFSFLQVRSTDWNWFKMPGKSKIELMSDQVRSQTDPLWAQERAGGLVAADITEEQFRISANASPHLKTSVD